MTTAFQFSLQNQLGRTYTLQSFAGRWLVLYFYPKDDTPGCTAEACSIRDSYQDLLNLGADVVGISKDTTKSHEKFAQKHGLQFSLLSDPTGSTIKAYGAWGKTMVGVKGILRKTLIIDPNGVIRKEYEQVTPNGHGEQIVRDLSELQAQ